MKLEKAKTEALNYLFERYKENPNNEYDILLIAKKYGYDSREFTKELKRDFSIKQDARFMPTGEAYCAITFHGISKVDSFFVSKLEQDVIQGLGDIGGPGNIMEILEMGKDKFQIGFDLSDYMHDTGLIDHPIKFFGANSIQASLTLKGKDEYDNKAGFVN